MTIAIEIRDLRKTYPRNWAAPPCEALRGISLEIGQGEAFGFIGPNGAGKSTTIKLLTGAMRPSGGSLSLFGIEVTSPDARRGLGYVPENPNLPDYLNPLEILSMGLALHGCRVTNPKRHCMNWLERFGLDDVANKIVRGFSKGMAQRTALAHAMAVKPRLLILDEPLSGLDPVGRRDVTGILAEYKREGGTLFFTSHVLYDVERLADRFGLIYQGELKTIQSPNELVGNDEMVTVRSLGSAPVAQMTQEGNEQWHAELSRSALWTLLRDIENAGHKLIEVKPTLTLESAFMHYLSLDRDK
ncbi:ABC transporter [Georgfuchsia toluolica]|uniref:ABC transporter n=1 Tax=Georgfuchsia toluolica TaxID=424218 RepID=A0A916J5G1_9PROT|nr:ABC transporter ATP-binding protein [Georgfuchsia toluolica]CAG4883783.1 ABC transporter [Georgfuchsia toluolica]